MKHTEQYIIRKVNSEKSQLRPNLEDKYVVESKYFNMVISSCGLLEGEKRMQRIQQIAKKNIWLAARCKNTCVKEEEELVNWLIQRCETLYRHYHVLMALPALMELGEYSAFCYLVGISTNFFSFKSVSDAFATLSWLIPAELAQELFNLLTDLGYPMDVRAFNGLMVKYEDREQIDNLMKEMSKAGVEADANTFMNRLRHSKSFAEALPYFRSFCRASDFQNIVQCSEAYHVMFKLAQDVHFIEGVYGELLSRPNGDEFKRAELEFHYTVNRMRLLSNPDEVWNCYWTYCKTYHSKILTEIHDYRTAIPRLERELEAARKSNKSLIKVEHTIWRLENERTNRMEKLEQLKSLSGDFRNELGFVCRLLFNCPQAKTTFLPFLSEVLKRFSLLFSSKEEIRVLINFRFSVEYGIRLWMEIWKLLKDYRVPMPSQILMLAVNVDTKTEMQLLLESLELQWFQPQEICAAMNQASPEKALFLYDYLKLKRYHLNLFIYNALLKNVGLNDAYSVIKEMHSQGIKPDIFSIQPLLRKWTMVNELFKIAELATSNQIDADKQVMNAIVRRTKELHVVDDLIDSVSRQDFGNRMLNGSWRGVFFYSCNILNRTA